MRKTAEVVVSEEGRDKGKIFVLTEMPASQAEKWAGRALLVAAQSGADIGNVRAGMAGVAVLGISSILGAKFSDVEPLLDEMFRCVRIKTTSGIVRDLIEDDIEEVETRVRLRQEVLTLHLGFSVAAALSTWMQGASAGQSLQNA